MVAKLSRSVKFHACYIASLPVDQQVEAARVAIAENPSNAPRLDAMLSTASIAFSGAPDVMEPAFLAVLTGKYWGATGVDLSVSFLDNPPVAVRDRILSHMNAWGTFANVKFSWSQSGGVVRINRGAGGYWSYLGTDIKMISRNEPTMNLQGFSNSTPESEYTRVVRHETGHTCGFPHEQLRQKIVNRLDVPKTLEYFRRTQGWSEATTRANVLTPLEERSITGSEITDETSIMCYQLPGSITKDGKPIPGGPDFSSVDREFAAKLYPKAVEPPPPPPALEVVIPKAGTWAWKSA